MKLEWNKIVFACVLTAVCSPLFFFAVFSAVYSVNQREFGGALTDTAVLLTAYLLTLASPGYAPAEMFPAAENISSKA